MNWKWDYFFNIITILTPLLLFFGRNTVAEWIKSSFAKDIQKFKHDLDIQKEYIKQDLHREAQRISYLSTSKQSLYPELYEKLRLAEGAVENLHGLRRIPNYEKYSLEDMAEVVHASKALNSIKMDILKTFETDKKSGADKWLEILRASDLQEARTRCIEVKNFLVLKSLYISKGICDLCFSCLKNLNSIAIDIEMIPVGPETGENIVRARKNAKDLLNKIEELMRKEIFGEQK